MSNTQKKEEHFKEFKSFKAQSPQKKFALIDDEFQRILHERLHGMLLGKILTVIDGSITDPQQNKAVKDIIRGIFSEEVEKICESIHNELSNFGVAMDCNPAMWDYQDQI